MATASSKVVGAVEREDAAQLLARKRMVGADARCLGTAMYSVPSGTCPSRPSASIIRSASCAMTCTVEPPVGPQRRDDAGLVVDERAARLRHPGRTLPRCHPTTSAFSEEQEVALSKVFEALIFSAAAARSAVSSTMTVTLPAPTATAGVPAGLGTAHIVLTARADDLVANLHQALRLVLGARRGDHLHQIGVLSDLGEFRMDEPNSRAQVSTPLGDGATTIALPHFSALMMLLAGVAAGFVEGTTAPMTPSGRAISVMPVNGSSLITPKVVAPAISRISPRVLRWFLVILSRTLPRPVVPRRALPVHDCAPAPSAPRPPPVRHGHIAPGCLSPHTALALHARAP
jgi:hypothetical protein